MVRTVDLQILGGYCYYRLNQCSNDEYVKILEYKSWIHRTWELGTIRKYFVFPFSNKDNEKIVKSSVGFAPILIRHLQSIGWMVNGKELFRAREIRLGNMLYRLYDYQEQAVSEWQRSGCCGVIKIATGGGKTISACEIIRRMGVRTIICMHTSDLLINAWMNTLVEQFGDEIKSKIGIVGGGLTKGDRKRMRIISDTSYEGNIKQDIVLATAQSLLNKLDTLPNERFGLLIWDETHHVGADQFNKVASSIRAKYRLGLSATLTRSDGTSPLIWGLMGDVVYRITIRELIKKGVLVEPIFNTITLNDNSIQNDISMCGFTKLNLSRFVKQSSASSVIKKNYVLKLTKSLKANNKKFIMYADYVSSKSSNVFTRDYYVEEMNKSGIRVIGVSSDMGTVERQKIFGLLENNKIDGLVFGKLGAEGVNIPVVDSIIMCNSTKSTILYPQRVGRGMRSVKGNSNKKNCFVYELLINTPLENRWSDYNFFEYEQEGYVKEKVFIK